MSEALRDYFRRLDRSLDCPRPLRRRLAAQVRRAAEDYCRERPEVGPAEVVQYLGDPAETARELLDGLEPGELDRAARAAAVAGPGGGADPRPGGRWRLGGPPVEDPCGFGSNRSLSDWEGTILKKLVSFALCTRTLDVDISMTCSPSGTIR